MNNVILVVFDIEEIYEKDWSNIRASNGMTSLTPWAFVGDYLEGLGWQNESAGGSLPASAWMYEVGDAEDNSLISSKVVNLFGRINEEVEGLVPRITIMFGGAPAVLESNKIAMLLRGK